MRAFPQILVFIPKIVRISTNSEVKTKKKKKKKGLRPIIYAKFHEFRGESTKTKQKQFLLTNSRAIISILGVSGLDLLSSSTEPVNFFGAQSSLEGAQFSFGEHKQLVGGHGPEMRPRGAGPGLI